MRKVARYLILMNFTGLLGDSPLALADPYAIECRPHGRESGGQCVCDHGYRSVIEKSAVTGVFTMTCSKPHSTAILAPPELVMPADLASNVGASVELVLQAPAWAKAVEVAICGDPQCSEVVIPPQITIVTSRELHITIDNLPPNRTLYWRARGVLDSVVQRTGSVRSFRTAKTSPRLETDDQVRLALSTAAQTRNAQEHFALAQRLSQSGHCAEVVKVAELPRDADSEAATEIDKLAMACRSTLIAEAPSDSEAIATAPSKIEVDGQTKAPNAGPQSARSDLNASKSPSIEIHNDDSSRSPRRFWVGMSGGMFMKWRLSESSNDLLEIFGVDMGVSRTWRDFAVDAEANVLPLGTVYKLQGNLYWGFGTTLEYNELCSEAKKLICASRNSDHQVRSIFGLRVGGALGQTELGRTSILEAALAMHGQLTSSIGAAYDFANRTTGVLLDFSGEVGRFYAGFEMLVFGHDGTFPGVFVISAGYTPGMW